MDSHESFTDLLIRNGVTVSRNLEESFAEVDETYPNFEDLDTPVETPKAKKTKIKCGRAFTDEEDNLIISAYLNISQDPIIGNGQKAGGYWKRVSEYFHQHYSGERRTPGSLMCRWSTIQLAVNKFCGFYDQVCARNRSGNNEDDKINETKTMFKKFAGASFKFEHSWNLLRYEQKWLSRKIIIESPVNDKAKGKGKKNVASSSSSEPISLGDDSAPTAIFYGQIERPGGRKAAKESVAKQRNDEHQQAKLQTTLDRMDENALKMHTEKMGLLKEAMAAERERDDHVILTMDMSNLDTPTKAYYKIKKVEILKRAGVLE